MILHFYKLHILDDFLSKLYHYFFKLVKLIIYSRNKNFETYIPTSFSFFFKYICNMFFRSKRNCISVDVHIPASKSLHKKTRAEFGTTCSIVRRACSNFLSTSPLVTTSASPSSSKPISQSSISLNV